MRSVNVLPKTGARGVREGDAAPVVYCKLFSDVVPELVCGMRREVLIAPELFSCKGCVTDITLAQWAG
jgi:hypothetical protein